MLTSITSRLLTTAEVTEVIFFSNRYFRLFGRDAIYKIAMLALVYISLIEISTQKKKMAMEVQNTTKVQFQE